MRTYTCGACGETFTSAQYGRTPKYCSRKCMGKAFRGGGPIRPRPGANERGYDAQHKRLREQWRPTVDAGRARCAEPICLMPDRAIIPGTRWDLAHNRKTGGYHGPAHARCNRSEAARYKNAKQAAVVLHAWSL